MPNVPPKAKSVPLIKDTKIASEPISALKCVYLDSDTTVAVADKDTTLKEAVYGVAITSAPVTGQNIEVVNYGQIDDPFFTFSANDTLYLGSSGVVTDIAPTEDDSQYRTIIGKSLGVGSIFVNISESITLN